MESLGTMLGVWAHPDDESFLMAGLMVQAIREGRRVVVVSATRGEGGIQDEARWPASQLVEIRTRELAESLRILGVTEHIWLDYPDGGCATAPRDEAVERLAEIIEKVQPDTVLGFGPDGITAHPDHIAVSGWTSLAFKRAAKPGARLLWATLSERWIEAFLPEWERIGAFMGEDRPFVTPDDQIEVDFVLSPDLVDLKFQALMAQESQTASTLSLVGEDFLRRDIAMEQYRLGDRK